MSVCGFVLVNANTPRNHQAHYTASTRNINLYAYFSCVDLLQDIRRPAILHDVL